MSYNINNSKLRGGGVHIMKKDVFKNDVFKLDEKSADDFWRLRAELFEELGEINKNMDISELKSATRQFYLSHINKDLISWGIFQNGKIVAIGSLCLFTRIPYRENLSGSEGYLLNIYTSPQFRKRGYANQILDAIIEYSQKNDIKRLWLNASEQGEKIYAERGFIKKENEMELFL